MSEVIGNGCVKWHKTYKNCQLEIANCFLFSYRHAEFSSAFLLFFENECAVILRVMQSRFVLYPK